MANGLTVALKIARSIERAHIKAAKEADREYKQSVRDNERMERAYYKALKDEEKERIKLERSRAVSEKALFKESLKKAKETFEKRSVERQELRYKFVEKRAK